MNINRHYVFFISLSIISIFFSQNLAFSQIQNDIEDPYIGSSTEEKNTNIYKSAQTINKKESLEENEDVSNDNKSYHFGVWVNYEQQFGNLENKLLTVGGPSFGFNLGRYFFIGAGIYSTFGYQSFNTKYENSFLYGGGIVGFRWNYYSPVVIRTQVLIGAIGFDRMSKDTPEKIEHRSSSLIVVPEIALDIRIFGYLFISIATSYRYVENIAEEWNAMQGLGALSGNISLGLSF